MPDIFRELRDDTRRDAAFRRRAITAGYVSFAIVMTLAVILSSPWWA